MNLEPVEWTRNRIREVGDVKLRGCGFVLEKRKGQSAHETIANGYAQRDFTLGL
jgi:hypothetical protein